MGQAVGKPPLTRVAFPQLSHPGPAAILPFGSPIQLYPKPDLTRRLQRAPSGGAYTLTTLVLKSLPETARRQIPFSMCHSHSNRVAGVATGRAYYREHSERARFFWPCNERRIIHRWAPMPISCADLLLSVMLTSQNDSRFSAIDADRR
jgi:hypothetical protein